MASELRRAGSFWPEFSLSAADCVYGKIPIHFGSLALVIAEFLRNATATSPPPRGVAAVLDADSLRPRWLDTAYVDAHCR